MLGLATIPEVSSEMNTTTRGSQVTTRQRRCGCCGEVGHDRRTCPDPTQIERRRQNRVARDEQYRIRYEQVRQNTISPMRVYNVTNENDYPIYIYWMKDGSDRLRYLQYLDSYGSAKISALPAHKIICIPVNELGIQLPSVQHISYTDLHTKYFVAGNFTLSDHEDLQVHVIAEYQPTKTELEQWKECGLKSLFLLKELKRVGANQYENLEPIMDMVQDINLPPHTELDKEMAGVPSVFTNIT